MIPSEPIPGWEYIDIVSLGILGIVITILMRLHHRTNGAYQPTISQTVAHDKTSSLIFSVVMSVCYPLYYAWMWLWVGPLLSMPELYYWMLGIAALFELVFVWVPARPGISGRVHSATASIVFFGMLALAGLMLATGQGLGAISIGLLWIFIGSSLVLGVMHGLDTSRQRTLRYELIFVGVFLSTMSIIAHV